MGDKKNAVVISPRALHGKLTKSPSETALDLELYINPRSASLGKQRDSIGSNQCSSRITATHDDSGSLSVS